MSSKRVVQTLINDKVGPAFAGPLSFFGVSPQMSQPAGAAQAALAAQSQDSLTDNSGGAASTTLAAITAPAANATSSLTADMTAVKNAIASQAAELGKLKSDVGAVRTLLAAIRTALVNVGLIKGGA